jgi:dihydropteroate synthase
MQKFLSEEIQSFGFPDILYSVKESYIGCALDMPADQRMERTAATVSIGVARG